MVGVTSCGCTRGCTEGRIFHPDVAVGDVPPLLATPPVVMFELRAHGWVLTRRVRRLGDPAATFVNAYTSSRRSERTLTTVAEHGWLTVRQVSGEVRVGFGPLTKPEPRGMTAASAVDLEAARRAAGRTLEALGARRRPRDLGRIVVAVAAFLERTRARRGTLQRAVCARVARTSWRSCDCSKRP